MNALRALVCASLATLPLDAQCEWSKLVPSDGLPDDEFGTSLDVDGGTLLVGAPSDDEGGSNTGAAFVFERQTSGWIEAQKLVASDASAGSRFGFEVALAGDLAVVGAFGEATAGFDAGAAYVFRKQGGAWVEVQKLTASNAAVGDLFGIDVAVAGDRVFVGACQLSAFQVFGLGAGKVFVFEDQGGTFVETDILTSSDGDDGDRFGIGLDSDGDGTRLVIGAQGDDDGGSQAGAAYVFDLVGGAWVETQKLFPSDRNLDQLFATSIALDGDRFATGAYLHDGQGTDAGAVYVFDLVGGTWTETVRLYADDGVPGASLGRRIALEGDLLLGGARLAPNPATGSAYLFELRDGVWSQVAKLVPTDLALDDQFGNGVALGDGRALVGSTFDDGSGSAYEFLARPATWTNYGCSNPPSSLTVVSGAPAVGSPLVFGLENPTGAQGVGAIPFVAFAFTPQPGFPCGVGIAGLGMDGGTGEVLIGLTPPNPVGPLLVGAPWGGPGTQAQVVANFPASCTLAGRDLFAQGLLFDPSSPVRFGLTDGLAMTVGY